MQAKYYRPRLEILVFNDQEVLTGSVHMIGVTAAEDLHAQYSKLLGGTGGAVTTVRLEDIKTR